jgi:hypothetical protein
MAKYGRNVEIVDWIWQRRLPFFFRSHIYAEYKLARALIEYDLVEDGGVEEHVARGIPLLFCVSSTLKFKLLRSRISSVPLFFQNVPLF